MRARRAEPFRVIPAPCTPVSACAGSPSRRLSVVDQLDHCAGRYDVSKIEPSTFCCGSGGDSSPPSASRASTQRTAAVVLEFERRWNGDALQRRRMQCV